MARFHFHLRNGDGPDMNEVGRNFSSLRPQTQTLLAARATTAATVLRGEVPLSRSFGSTDRSGLNVLTMPFNEAVHLS